MSAAELRDRGRCPRGEVPERPEGEVLRHVLRVGPEHAQDGGRLVDGVVVRRDRAGLWLLRDCAVHGRQRGNGSWRICTAARTSSPAPTVRRPILTPRSGKWVLIPTRKRTLARMTVTRT